MQIAPARSQVAVSRDRTRTLVSEYYVPGALALIALYAFGEWVLSSASEIGDGSLRAFLLAIAAALLAVIWLPREGGPTRAWLELIVGATATPAIGAVVGPRIQEFGFSIEDVAGVAAAAGGLLLLATGATKLVRHAGSGWRRLLAIPIAWLLVEFVMMPVGFGVYATNAPHPVLGTSTPAQFGMSFEEIALMTEDGVELSAWYVEGDNGAGIVMLHGAGSTKANLVEHASILAERGYSLLLLDARGHGASEGPIMDWGWFAAADVAPAIEFLDERTDGRIGLFGLSMGGESAITSAAVDERIAAVVSEGAGNRTTADVAAHAESLMGRIAVAQSWLTYTIADLLTPATPPMALDDAMKMVSPQPVLLISGRDDAEVEANMTWARAGGDAVSIWVLRDTPHTAGLATHPEMYKDKVVGFLDEGLLDGR